MNLDRYDDALAELDLATAAAAPSADELKMRGEIYMHQKKWSEAAGALKQALATAPQDAELAEWMGRADLGLKDYPAAVQILQQAYAQDAQNADTLRDLSEAFSTKTTPLLWTMDRLAKLETPRPGSWFVRAICYDKLARKTEAIEAYQKFWIRTAGSTTRRIFRRAQRILVLQKELGQSKKK